MAKRKHPRGQKTRSSPGAARGTPGVSEGLLIWGVHPVRAALRNPGRRVLACHATKKAADAVFAGETPPPALTVQPATTQELEVMLPPGAVHQGVVLAVDPLPQPDFEAILDNPGASGPLVVLDQVTDPHNVGAILRSCAVFGVPALVTTDRHAPPETGTLAKSAAGALDVVPWVRVGNLAQALDQIRNAGWWVAGLSGDAETAIGDARLGGSTSKTALVLGAEGSGIRRLTKEKCDILVRIPMSYDNNRKYVNLIDSLNVSNAAAVALYELSRD